MTESSSQSVLPETNKRLRRLVWIFFAPLVMLAGVGGYYLAEDRRLAHQRAQADAEEYLPGAVRQVGLAEALAPRLTQEKDGSWTLASDVEPEAVIYRDWDGNDVYPLKPNKYVDEFELPELAGQLADLWRVAEAAEFREAPAVGVGAYREFLQAKPPLNYEYEARYRWAILALRDGDVSGALAVVNRLVEDTPAYHPVHQRAQWLRVTRSSEVGDASLEHACSSWVMMPTAESRAMLAKVEQVAVWKDQDHINERWREIKQAGWQRMEREDRAREVSRRVPNRLSSNLEWKLRAYLVDHRPEDLFVMRRPAPTKQGHLLVAWTQGQLGQKIGPLLSAEKLDQLPRPETVNMIQVRLDGRGIWGHAWPTRSQIRWLRADHNADLKMSPIATNVVEGFQVVASVAPGAIVSESNKRAAWFALLMLFAAGISVLAWRFARRSLLHLDALNQEKSNFVSSVSHELRAPVASMQLMAESLFDGKVRDEKQQREYFGMILRECRRLGALVHNVLDFARIEQRRKRYEFSPCDLRELVEHVANLMRPSAGERGISVRVDGPPLEAEIDAAALQQAVINLLDNAIKFSPANSEVTVELGELPDGGARLMVKDQGPGVPPEQREKIFERFYRREDELRRETMGVGIGLSIVKHVISAHGGAVKVVGNEGPGAAFVIELPARPPEQEDVTNLDS